MLNNYTGGKISASLGYVTVRGEGMIERARGELNAFCAVASHSSPYFGWLASTCTVNKARRYLAQSITPWDRVLEKLIITRLAKKVSVFLRYRPKSNLRGNFYFKTEKQILSTSVEMSHADEEYQLLILCSSTKKC
jgi:hypothetical protein